MKITFDSNAWERMFDPSWECDLLVEDLRKLRTALRDGVIHGFICGTALQLETVRKTDRSEFVAESRPTLLRSEMVERDGALYMKLTIGPDNTRHPGLHKKLQRKIQLALDHGIQFIDGNAWFSLPSPAAQVSREHFVPLTKAELTIKENRQTEVFRFLNEHGVGKRIFDDLLKELEFRNGLPHGIGGWAALLRAKDATERKRISNAVAEWCDAEVVAAHYGFAHDAICTLDEGKNAGRSVFDKAHRQLLDERFGIRIISISELSRLL